MKEYYNIINYAEDVGKAERIWGKAEYEQNTLSKILKDKLKWDKILSYVRKQMRILNWKMQCWNEDFTKLV